MKKLERAKLGLARLTPTDLVEKGRNHINCCTANANITLPATFLQELGDACDALEVANIAVRDNGGKLDTLRRNKRVPVVQDLVRVLEGYVSAQCLGDGEKITSTGFELVRSPQPVGVLDAVTDARAERGKQRGDVVLRWNAKRGRINYSLQMNGGDPNSESDWRWAASTSRTTITLRGLETDKQYYFRVRANSAAGAGKLSDVCTSKAA